jgi:uncharacterized protein YjiS (DUF1127 family)
MKFAIASMLRTDERRRHYREMLALDDRLLADAGTTRLEITRVAGGTAPRFGSLY